MSKNKEWHDGYTQEQIDILKNNFIVNEGLVDELAWMKEAFVNMPNRITRTRGSDSLCWSGDGLSSTYYLDSSFELPKPEPEAEEGYCIVSMEDRERCAYPVDCDDVRYASDLGYDWDTSEDPAFWEGGYEDILFAVPLNYTFAEDRVSEYRAWVMGDVPPLCWFRRKNGDRAINMTHVDDAGIGLGLGGVTYPVLSADYEHSTDLKTWKPCKVEL